MHGLLSKLLQKRGIDNINDLDKEEKQTWNEWEKILSKEELSIEDIKQFCNSQLGVIKGKWSNLDTDTDKKKDLIPYFVVYSTLLQAIDSPRSVRESLEKQLNQLIK